MAEDFDSYNHVGVFGAPYMIVLSAKTIDVDFVFLHFVIEDSFGRAEQPRGFCAISAGGLERILDEILLISRNSFVE